MKGAPYDNNDGNRKKTAHVRSQPAQTESQLNPYKVNYIKKEVNLFSKDSLTTATRYSATVTFSINLISNFTLYLYIYKYKIYF